MARTRFWVCVHRDLDLGYITSGQGHGTPLGHGQQLWVILSRSDKVVNMKLWPGHNVNRRGRQADEQTDRGSLFTINILLQL